MYLLLLILLLAAGAAIAARGVRRQRSGLVIAGIGWSLAALLLFPVMSLWGEALWFAALGYAARFWIFLATQAGVALLGAVIGAGAVALLTRSLSRQRPRLRHWPALAGAIGGALTGLGGWQSVLVFLNRGSAGIREPIFGIDAGFYLFSLPLLDLLHGLLVAIALIAGASAIAALMLPRAGSTEPQDPLTTRQADLDRPLLVISFAIAAVVALGIALDAFHLLYADAGIVTGPGWTDVHVRLPGYLVVTLLIPLCVGAVLVPTIRTRAAAVVARFTDVRSDALRAVGFAWALAAVGWLLFLGLLPWLAQSLVVEPNEITLERPYIENNIEMTRAGFDLTEVEERQYPARQGIDRETIAQNENLISELRLWDWRALDAVYQQFQEIRLYYEFSDVDIDRYELGDRYREVMVSAREVAQANLPPDSQTFVNKRFKYTHGYGVTLAAVSDFTESGLPNLLVRDIPPVASYEEAEIERPEIYFGELTRQPVVGNTEEPEFDYPSGEENVYASYEGRGGVQLSSFWRKFLFGWKFDGTPFLLSSYPHSGSRVMFHRQIEDRARRLAPFLEFDEDPYIVIADGRLYWIIDAYTHSDRFPYSEAFDAAELGQASYGSGVPTTNRFDGSNYMRNAVKVVVDAYEGSVDFYVFEPDDPIIRVWRKALPGMFKDRSEMPAALERHVRYPQGLLLTQGLVYAKYHMTDPTVFYNQEDLWVRATEKHYDRTQPVEPYYIMWELPGSDESEFVLMLPFTPKDRQVLVGWIAGLSDRENYGRFLAYKFPKEKRVLGPQQVETKIDQDRFLSGQLTLWDQRGSNVIRGNVLAIPLDGSLLCVEPIYLQAETAAYPELRVVVVMQGDNMSYGDSLDEALSGLLAGETPTTRAPNEARAAGSLAQDANAAFEDYLEAQGDGRFEDAAAALERLQSLLQELTTAERPTL